MSHGHAHGWDDADGAWEEPLDAATRTLLGALVAVIALATVIGLVIWWPRGEVKVEQEELGFADRVDATVTDATTAPCSHDPEIDCSTITVEVTEGEGKGTVTSLEYDISQTSPASRLDAGDKIVLDDAGVLGIETVAMDVVQTLVGSIGLVASVPLTTALACVVATRGQIPLRRFEGSTT